MALSTSNVATMVDEMITAPQPPPRSATKLEKNDVVKVFGLMKATDLNGKIGLVVKAPKDGRVGIRFVDDDKAKLVKLDNLELMNVHRHFHVEDRDIPGHAFISDSGSEVQVRIENGKGKMCNECGNDLENKYHVTYDGKWFCEEDYVKKYLGDHHPAFKVCALCHEYMSVRQIKALPVGILDHVYPDGKLPNGRQIGVTRPGSNADEMIFFAHTKCFVCHLCGIPMYMRELHSNGFVTQMHDIDGEPPLIFLCNAPPGGDHYCNNIYDDVVKARKRLSEIESLSTHKLCQILNERDVLTHDGEGKDSLIRKVVVTDDKRGQKVAHVVTTKCARSYNADLPGAFANRACVNDSCGCKYSIVSSRAMPGSKIIDRSCQHGHAYNLVCWDDWERAWKRSVSGKFMEESFSLFRMTDGQCQSAFLGCPVSAFINACNLTGWLWFTEGRDVLLADRGEYFIPKMMWSVAVSTCSKEDGSFEYTRFAVAISLITSHMIDMLNNNDDMTGDDLRKMLSSGKLFRQLKEIERGPKSLYTFMDSPGQRRCDCVQYVATAASIGRLRLKDSKVKNAKQWCAYCHAALGRPKFCSLCKEVAYCGKYHLSQHWKIHKKECKGCRNAKPSCALCQMNLDDPKVCSLCKEVAYCSKEHSAQHWREVHKKECKGHRKNMKREVKS